MLDRVCGKHNITDINFIPQGAGDTGINNRTDAETVGQDLAAHPRIHLADAGAHHHCVPAA